MPKVNIEQSSHDRGIVAGNGVRLWLDDQEVKELTNVEVTAHVDDIVRVSFTAIVENGWTFSHPAAQVNFNVVSPGPDFVIISTPKTDGSVEHRCLYQPVEEGYFIPDKQYPKVKKLLDERDDHG